MFQINISDYDNCAISTANITDQTGITIHEQICETVYLASGHLLDAMDQNVIQELRINGFEITMEWT